jgi:hypothetical protein
MSMSKLDDLAAEIRGIWARADDEGRPTTESERRQVEGLLKSVESEKVRARMNEVLGGDAVDRSGPGMTGFQSVSPGERFVMSDGYKAVQSAQTRGQQWTTGPVDVGAWGRRRAAPRRRSSG